MLPCWKSQNKAILIKTFYGSFKDGDSMVFKYFLLSRVYVGYHGKLNLILIEKLERQKGWKSINLEFCEEYSAWQAHIFYGSWGVLLKLLVPNRLLDLNLTWINCSWPQQEPFKMKLHLRNPKIHDVIQWLTKVTPSRKNPKYLHLAEFCTHLFLPGLTDDYQI